jgi:UDP-glucuronate 4-epimerase
MQPGDVAATYASTDALNKWVGFAPCTPLQDGIDCFVAWYRSYYQV